MALLAERPPQTKPSKVPQETFLGVIWAGVALSFLFLLARLLARAKTFRRLFWDDALVVLAWILSMLTAVDWQIVSKDMYQFVRVTSGQLWPPPATLIPDTERYYKGSMIALAFFYASLWFVKFAFLLFFRRLGKDIRALSIQWWIITIFTGLSFAACFADTQYWCLVAPLEKIIARCSSDHDIYWELFTLKFNCALDVVTDCLILSIPFVILWHVRVPLQKKLALVGLFSLVMITMLFAILRVALITSFSRQPETSWAYMWTSLEQNMAIIVACLGAFRTLFVQDKPLAVPAPSLREVSRRIFQRQKPRHPLDVSISMGDYETASKVTTTNKSRYSVSETANGFTRLPSQGSETPIIPPDRMA